MIARARLIGLAPWNTPCVNCTRLSPPLPPPVVVAAIYRRLHVLFTTPVNLGLQLSTTMTNYAHKIILGDFNADQLNTSFDAVYIRSLISDLSLHLVDHGATHTQA